ncbi:MAG: MIP family channel protein [Bacteroidota bacterium]|nr:MIP family channel protein [Bacteroidota bacterium]
MKKYLAEFIGTFALIFCGTGAIIINQETNGTIGHIGIAFTFGLIVIAMIYSFGHVSGAHINPTVTLGLWLAKRFKGKEILPYISMQILGGITASILLKFLFPNNINLGATLPAGSEMQSFILELILTFILMLVILYSTEESNHVNHFAGLAIGGTVLLEALFAGPICGASMNPARSLAPALVSGNFTSLWLYIIAPVLGALLASGVRRLRVI